MITLWRLLGRPAATRFGLALGLAAAAGACAVGLLGLSGWFLTAAAIAGATGAAYSFNHLYPSAGVRAVAFGRVLTRYGEQLIGHDATLRLAASLRPQLFAARAQSQPGLHGMPSDALAEVLDDVTASEAGFLRVISPAAGVVAGLAVAVALAFAVDLLAGLFALTAAVVVAGLLPFAAVARWRPRARELANARDKVRAQTGRVIDNAIELDIIGALNDAANDLERQLAEQLSQTAALDQRYERLALVARLTGACAALFVAGRAVIAGVGPLPLAVGAALALMAAFDAAATMVGLAEAVNRSTLAARRLASRLAHAEACWNTSISTAAPLESVLPLEVRDLVARPAPDAPATSRVSFTLDAGQILQVEGPAGSGKTTLAETLMRLREPASGSLSYAGIAAARVRIASVLSHVAIAPQFPAFLPGTLEDQLRLAAPQASREAMRLALETACLEQVIARGDGLASKFADDSMPFSGGELRRIAIARALLASPELLILDEPFAGLDAPLADMLLARLVAWTRAGRRSLMLLVHEHRHIEAAGLTQQVIPIGSSGHKRLRA